MQLFESWAHHLSPHQFAEFGKPYAEHVLRGVKALHPETPVIYHANGGKFNISCFTCEIFRAVILFLKA